MVLAAALASLALGLGAPPMGQGAVEDDCAVIAAVAQERWGFNNSDRPPPPLWLTGYEDREPVCGGPGSRLVFTPLPPERHRHDVRGEQMYLVFARPAYHQGVARVEAYYRRASYAASLPEVCELVRVDGLWRVRECLYKPVS